MTTIRLKENHPAFKAFDKLCAKAEELGIEIHFDSNRTYVYFEGKEYILKDIEEENYPMNYFPIALEYKLTYEK